MKTTTTYDGSYNDNTPLYDNASSRLLLHRSLSDEAVAIDPSPWLLIFTTAFCFLVLLVAIVLSRATISKAIFQKDVFRYDRETRKILKLVIPYTAEIVFVEAMSLLVLIMIAQWVVVEGEDGTASSGGSSSESVAAYAMVHILVELVEGILSAPMDACSTLCARALGAKNYKRSGQYAQLSLFLYVILNVPVLTFWYYHMQDTLLWLGWATTSEDDNDSSSNNIAALAQSYFRSYLGCILFGEVTDAITQFWDVQGHADVVSILEIADGAVTVLVLAGALQYYPSLETVGWVCTVLSIVSLIVAMYISHSKGYLRKFYPGLFGSWALQPRRQNKDSKYSLLKPLLSTALPVAGHSLLDHGEWAVLTVIASFVGPTEVAAWAILGNIWDFFYALSDGVGEAAELRISIHLGNNNPQLAERSTFKCLVIGLLLTGSTSIILMLLRNVLPTWFVASSSDDDIYSTTIQNRLKELLPFVAVANVAMAAAMNGWYILGSQGRFTLATWIFALGSWGVCLPLAALSVFVFHLDLQALASALAVGSTLSGACLVRCTIKTDWEAVALKISTENAEDSSESESESDDDNGSDNECLASSHGINKGGSLGAALDGGNNIPTPTLSKTFDTVDSEEQQEGKERMSSESTPLVPKSS